MTDLETLNAAEATEADLPRRAAEQSNELVAGQVLKLQKLGIKHTWRHWFAKHHLVIVGTTWYGEGHRVYCGICGVRVW